MSQTLHLKIGDKLPTCYDGAIPIFYLVWHQKKLSFNNFIPKLNSNTAAAIKIKHIHYSIILFMISILLSIPSVRTITEYTASNGGGKKCSRNNSLRQVP